MWILTKPKVVKFCRKKTINIGVISNYTTIIGRVESRDTLDLVDRNDLADRRNKYIAL